MVYRAGVVAFVLWGVLTAVLGAVFLGVNMFGPADAFASIPAATSPHARALIKENNVMMIASGLWVLGLAIRSWRRPGAGHWTMVGIASVGSLNFMGFELIPGLVPWSQGGLTIVLWLAAVVLFTVGVRRVAGAPSPTFSANNS